MVSQAEIRVWVQAPGRFCEGPGVLYITPGKKNWKILQYSAIQNGSQFPSLMRS